MDEQEPAPTCFQVLPDLSAILVEARSTVGPIVFGTAGVTGYVRAVVAGGRLDPATAEASLEFRIDQLQSGNSLYDAELLRRIDARRFPWASVTMHDGVRVGGSDRFTVSGEVTFHGVTRTLSGSVTAVLDRGAHLTVTGEQVIDIRDFDLTSPAMLMLKIYPDVRVRLHLEADAVEGPGRQQEGE